MAYGGKTTSGKLGTGGDNEVGADSGTATTLEPGKNLTVTGGEGIDTSIASSSGNLTVTVAAEEATDANKGVASFASADFSVSSGAVSLVDLTTSHVAAATLVIESEGIGSNDNDTTIPTSAAVKDYVDTKVTAEDLDITTDSGTIAIDLDSETFTISGGEGVDTSATGNAVTIACEDSAAANKGVVIVAGGTGATVGYSSGTATVSVDAAQTQITSVGTITTGTLSTGAAIADVTVSIGSDADGDVFYRASNKLARLAKGSAAQVLTMNSGATAPEWATAAGGGDTTELHVQTDASSGSGSEATVDADAGVVMCVTASGARYVQLPAVATDRRLFVKDKSGNAATNNISILTNGSEEIDGSSANLVISTNYASVQLVSDGTKWYII